MLHTTITINSVITFAPPPSDARPAFTARQALRQSARHIGSRVTPIPPGLTVRLGVLTYQNRNKLAYGYSTPSTCVGGNDLHPLPPRPCLMWEFVGANTGWMIVGAEQLSRS